MSDVGEHIVTDTEADEVAAAALQRSRFGITAEVVLLYVVCIGAALALAAVLVAADRWVVDQRLHGDARRQPPQARPMGADPRRHRTDPARCARHDRQRPRRPGQHRPGGPTRHRCVLRRLRRRPPRRTGSARARRDDRVRRGRRCDLGRHRRRPALLPQRPRGADHAADGRDRGQPHGLGAAQPVPAAGAGGGAGQPQPGERAARS